MPTWTQVLTDQFARADTSPGGAGTSTGAGNGWVDFHGGNFSISGDTLKCFQDNNTPSFSAVAYQPGSAYRDQQASLTTVPSADPNTAWFLAFRMNPGATTWYVCSLEAGGDNLRIWAYVGGTQVFLNQVGLDGAYDPTHVYTLEGQCFNAAPTTISVTLTDVTTSSLITTLTATDSTAGLQAAGFQGVGAAGAGGSGAPSFVSSVTLWTGTPQPGVISVTGTTATTIGLSATAPTGGQAPIAYQWYASQTAGFTPGGGNTLSGQTGLTLTHVPGTASGTAWFYVLKTTDANAVDLTPPQAAAVVAYAPQVIGLIGDSIALSAGSAPDFCAALAALAPGHTFSVNNQGDSGATSAAWLPNAGPLEPAITAFLGAGVRRVMIALGVNDSKDGPGYTPIPPAAYQANISAVCGALVTAGFTPVLNGPGCTVAGSGAGAFTGAAAGRELAYHAALDAAANGTTILRGDRYLWAWSAENAGSYYGTEPDGVHPSPAGLTRMEVLWADAYAAAAGLLAPTGSPAGGLFENSLNGGFQ